MKRFLSMLLAALMLVSVLPFAVLADEPAEDPSAGITSSITGLTDELNRKLEEDKVSTAKGEASDSEYPWGGLTDAEFKEYVFKKENADYLKKLLTKTGSAENKAFRARVRAIGDNAVRKAVQDYLDRLVSGEEDIDEPEDVLSAEEREELDKNAKRRPKEDDPGTGAAKARAEAFAEEYAEEAASSAELLSAGSGVCGDDLTWELTSGGVLTISGTGRMYDFDSYSDQPWYDDSESICSVVIQKGVTSIGSGAFGYFEELDSVEIPEGVTSIGDDAFAWCLSLDSITLPQSLTSIGYDTFSHCRLSSVTIPKNVTFIGESPFYECRDLSKITVAAGNTMYRSEENCIIEKQTGHLVCGCNNSTIPSGVTYIDPSAFAGCEEMESAVIPQGVTGIGDCAFADSGVRQITIPVSVTFIGYCAFDMSALKDVYYKGTQAEWNNISIHSENYELLNADLHFGTAPTTQVSVTLSKNKALITWKQVSGATGYKLYMRVDSESTPSKTVTVKKGTTLKYTYSGLVPGHEYHFSVTPILGDTTGERSGEKSIIVYPDTPKLKVKRKGGEISISWSSVKGAAYYGVEVTDSEGHTDYYEYGSSVKKTTVQAKRSGIHTIDLQAFSSTDLPSGVATASVDVALDTPKLKAKVKNNVITASWSAVKGVAGYKLTITDSAGNSNTQTLGASDKKAILTVAPSGAYTISLYAFSGEMTSKTATVNGTVALTGTALKAKASKGQVTLSWKQVKTADRYEIWRAEGSSDNFELIATCVGSLKKDVDPYVTIGETYTYKIRPVGNGPYSYGEGPVTGPWSAPVRVVVK